MDDFEFVLPATSDARGPKKLLPKFYIAPQKNQAKTLKEGRPIYDDVEFIELRIPGNVKDVFVEKVNQKWIEEYPVEYKHWKATQKQLISGTPLSQYPKMTRSRVMELNALGIMTLEQFAGLTDSQMQGAGMGTRAEIAQVKAFLQAAADTAIVTKQAAELEKQNAEIADLKRQIAEIAARQNEPRRRAVNQ